MIGSYIVLERRFGSVYNPEQGEPKPQWVFLRADWQEVMIRDPFPGNLWAGRKANASLFVREEDAVAAMLMLEDVLDAATMNNVRIVRHDQQP